MSASEPNQESVASKDQGIKIAIRIVGCLAFGAVAVYLSGFAAVYGAVAGGLEEGGWNWQFLGPLAAGWSIGLTITIVTAILLFWFTQSTILHWFGVLVAAPSLCFFGGMAVYFAKLRPQKQAISAKIEILERVRAEPFVVDQIIEHARNGSMSDAERGALWHIIWESDAVKSKDIPFLVNYFRDDVASLAALLKYQPIADQELRLIYDSHKARQNRIPEELVELKKTPLDILVEISQHNELSDKYGKYDEHLIKRANDAITDRKAEQAVAPNGP